MLQAIYAGLAPLIRPNAQNPRSRLAGSRALCRGLCGQVLVDLSSPFLLRLLKRAAAFFRTTDENSSSGRAASTLKGIAVVPANMRPAESNCPRHVANSGAARRPPGRRARGPCRRGRRSRWPASFIRTRRPASVLHRDDYQQLRHNVCSSAIPVTATRYVVSAGTPRRSGHVCSLGCSAADQARGEVRAAAGSLRTRPSLDTSNRTSPHA